MKRLFTHSKIYFSLMIISTFGFIACADKRSDEQIEQDVKSRLLSIGQNSTDAYANIDAGVKDGIITLSGKCEGDNCADSVMARVKDVEGVKEVINNITEEPTPIDYTLRSSVQTIISKYQGVQADVAAGVIVLRGTIKREQIQPLMNELSALKPKKIDNQLAIQ